MNSINELRMVQSKARAHARGLGAILCYDPYFDRMLHSVRKSLTQGHPVMVRLHSAAQYPAPEESAYSNDLESHAVLIVGYDDSTQRLAILDPWNNCWGGNKGGLRWVPYKQMSMLIVNSTKDCYMVPAPLEVKAEVISDAEAKTLLVVRAGFHAPDAIVMDQANLMVREVSVNVGLPKGWSLGSTHKREAGAWRVGEQATVIFPLREDVSGEVKIQVEVEARVTCERPYPFEDLITTRTDVTVKAQDLRIARAV